MPESLIYKKHHHNVLIQPVDVQFRSHKCDHLKEEDYQISCLRTVIQLAVRLPWFGIQFPMIILTPCHCVDPITIQNYIGDNRVERLFSVFNIS